MTLSNAGPVLLVGAGKMGIALAEGWIAGGLKGDQLILVDPKPSAETQGFAERVGAHLVAALPSQAPRVVVLAVKPQVMPSVLPDVRALMAPETVAVSIAAGITLSTLTGGLDSQRVVRAMPNTPAQIGKGMVGAFGGPNVSADDRDLVDALLRSAGDVIWLGHEGMIDAITSVSGSGPAYVFHMVEALAAAAEEQGFDSDAAMRVARQTIVGAAALLESSELGAEQLRKNVTSPNGTTQAALEVLMGEEGLKPLMSKTVAAARARSEELGR